MSTLAGSTELIYLQPFVQRISLEVYLGNNQVLPANVDEVMNHQVPAYFVDYFQKLNAKRRGELIDLFILEQFVVDIVLAHDKGDSSTLPLQALVLYANFKNITLNLQLNTLSQITNISNQITGFQALTSISETRPSVRLMGKKELENFAAKYNLNGNQTAIVRLLNKEIVRELFAIPLWQDIYLKYKVLGTVDVRRRICFKYKIESLVYQLLTGKSKAEIELQFKTFLESERNYLQDLEDLERMKRESESGSLGFFSSAGQDDSMRAKVNRQFQRISKATYKFHVHFRLHSNLYINYLNPQLKKDFSVVINGLDLNIVKPKGRFHANLGLMLKNFLVMFNLDKMQKQTQRSIFDGPPKGSVFSERESVRPSATNAQGGQSE
jgi:hypothetical protein